MFWGAVFVPYLLRMYKVLDWFRIKGARLVPYFNVLVSFRVLESWACSVSVTYVIGAELVPCESYWIDSV